MAGLANQLAVLEREEVAQAIRRLLAQPLVHRRADPEAFEVIRRRHQPVAMWFDHYLGWSLVVEPRLGYARLAKIVAEPDPTRPARRLRSTRAAFDRRRYVLFTLIAAELLATPTTVIGALAERVRAACAADADLPAFDAARHSERLAFVDALLLLESLGAVAAVDGTTEAFADSTEAKVLYRVDTTRLLRLLATPLGASQFPELDAEAGAAGILERILVEPRYGDTGEPAASGTAMTAPETERRNLWLRHRVLRRIVDDPVVYRADLTPAELAYATSLSGRALIRKAAEIAGFVLEERAEGWLLVDPTAVATDWRFPDDSSTANVAALLLLDRLNEAGTPLDAQEAQRVAATRLASSPNWAKAYQTPDGAARLTAEAIDTLVAVDLVSRGEDGRVSARPAAARYAVTAADRSTGQPSPARDRRRPTQDSPGGGASLSGERLGIEDPGLPPVAAKVAGPTPREGSGDHARHPARPDPSDQEGLW